MRKFSYTLFLGLLGFCSPSLLTQVNAQLNVFVRTTPAGTGDGSSWNDAYDGRLLAQFLRNNAVEGTRVYVAEGIYFPYLDGVDDPLTAREYAFDMKHGVEMIGGFSATAAGIDLSSYDPKNNVTRLSGEIQNTSTSTDNSYHVVRLAQNSITLIDGFYISDGYADNDAITDAINGGGVLDFGGTKDLLVRMSHLVVENNSANFGGGIYFKSNFGTLLDSVIIRNNTTFINYGGSGIFAWGNFGLINSTIHHNSSDGILSWGGDMLIRNSTISDNGLRGIKTLNNSFGNLIRVNLVNSTISNNGSFGIQLQNYVPDSTSIAINNSLIINNSGGNYDTTVDPNGGDSIHITSIQYTIIGTTKFITQVSDSLTIPIPVALGELVDNGGWGPTRALLDSCNNPAVSSGNPDIVTNPLTQFDQRGVLRNNPPCIGAYDGLTGFFITTWTALGRDSVWNNSDNWSHGVPTPCAHAIIPAGLTSYPILQEAGVGYEQAVCDTIEFEMGGEIAQQQYLQYQHAKVQLKVPSNRWYMVAPPLRDMYTGDYLLRESINRQSPAVYMMKYQSDNPETGAPAVAGSWSNPFNSLTQDLTPGLGYVIWVDKTNNTDVSTFYLPQDSTTYAYYHHGGGYWYTDTRTMPRTNSGRFIYETGNWNGTQGSSVAPASPFTLPVDGSEETAVVGNPFMSHLDFTAFHSANGSSIENSYYIWSGGNFTANIVTDWGTISSDPSASEFNNMIAPLQSFIVKKADAAPAFSSLNFSFSSMSKIYPDTNTFRSLETGIPNLIHLEIWKNNQHQSAVALLYREGQSNQYHPKKDTWTLFNDSVKETAIVYSLLGGKAASIRTIGDLSEPIEIGIRSLEKGSLTLRITGLDHFDSKINVYLEDKITQHMQNLREIPLYTFNNDSGNIQGRFYLKIINESTDMEEFSTESVLKVYILDGKLYIKSMSSNPIQQVDVYNAQGLLLNRQQEINSNHWEININKSTQLLIVRVQTLHKTQSKKILY